MLRLVLDGTEVDLYENESVNLTLQFSDVQNIQSTTGSFSQTFRLPATPTNLDFFGPIDEAAGVGVKNPKERIPAELVSGTTPILRGFCQIKAIYIQKEKFADVEVVFFAGAVDLRSELAGKMLTDLNLNSYDHTLNLSNIQSSWLGNLLSGDVRYGLIDKGFNWSFPDSEPWSSTDGLEQGELTPFIRAKAIFDEIMDGAGYTYDSTFFDTTGAGNFDRIYLPAYNGAASPLTDEAELGQVRAALEQDYTTASLAVLDVVDDATNGVDDGDNWSNTTNRYTAPYTGLFTVDITYSYVKHGSGPTDIFVYRNGTELLQLDTASTIGYNRTQTLIVLMVSGDYIDLRGEAHGATAVIYGNDTVGTGIRTDITVTPSPPMSGQEVRMAANLPEMSQIDFVLGLQRMFNLVFVPDKVKPNHLIIEPFTDYTSTGTAKDWTNLVDYSKDVTLTPTTDLQSQRYAWTYSPGTDFVSDAIQKSLDRVYGAYRVLDAQNDFATGDQTVQTTFGQYMTSLIPGSSFPVHRSLKADGSKVDKPLPMLAYWHGTSTNYGQWYVRNDSHATAGPSSLFPSFSNYSTDFATVTDKDLNYGMESPFFPIQANPANTLYFQYWAQYVAELYSEEARLLSCTIRLSRSDLADFEFSDRIFIRDAYYRVLKLSYDANVEGVCTVELIKELSDIEVCEDTPTGFDDRNNVVTFNNSATDYGNQTCCELYGYEWVRYVDGGVGYQRCKPRTQTNQPT
jgi:hypothetical protein